MQASIYTFPGYVTQGTHLAEKLQIPCHEVKVHRFPDKESLVTLPATCSEHAIFYLSLDYPNNKLIELLFACKTARQQGVKRISLLAPYLCYMRQDIAFHDTEAVSQQIIGQWLSELVDDVITIDPHLHRHSNLDEVIPDTNNIVLSATEQLGEFVLSLKQTVHLLGPDEESKQWVQRVAKISGSSFSVATKKRFSDTRVEIALPEKTYQKQHIILIDDVISTGHTIAETAKRLYQLDAFQVDVMTTHALFSEGALTLLKDAKIKNIWSSDTISHSSNSISLTPLIAKALKTIL